jgi:hypothetical protein
VHRDPLNVMLTMAGKAAVSISTGVSNVAVATGRVEGECMHRGRVRLDGSENAGVRYSCFPTGLKDQDKC